MHQTKLVQLLKAFSNSEVKAFGYFLQSPLFNKNELFIEFYRLLASAHPKMDSRKLEKEKIHAKLYGSRPYNDKTMRDLTSELFKLAKTFIAQNELLTNELEASDLRFKWMIGHNLHKLAASEIDGRQEKIDAIPTRDFN